MRDGQNLYAGLSFPVNDGERKTLKDKFSRGKLADRPSLRRLNHQPGCVLDDRLASDVTFSHGHAIIARTFVNTNGRPFCGPRVVELPAYPWTCRR